MIQYFRKKPILVPAVQLLPSRESILEVEQFIEGKEDVGQGSSSVASEKFDEYCSMIIQQGGRKIRTLESHDADLLASFGDYVLKGVNGEFYPCKPDILAKTYEEVEKPTDNSQHQNEKK
jgi:hypothetical protein